MLYKYPKHSACPEFMVLENIIHISMLTRVAITLLSKADEHGIPVLFVLDYNSQLVGSLTDMDVRKGLADGKSLDDPLSEFLNPNYFFIEEGEFSGRQFKELREKKEVLVPLLDSNKRIVRLLNVQQTRAVLPLDVVLMAGGKGKRLFPLTQNVPKPLLKVGDKPLLEHNVDRLISFGLTRFFIPVHFLAHKISEYLGNGEKKSISIRYVLEEKPLGTVGALRLINDFKHDTVLLMNADLLTDMDFQAFYQEFLDKDADLAVATCPYRVSLPFGVMEINEDQQVESLREKPNFTYFTNGGIYLIKRKLLDLIPKDGAYDATDLVQKAIEKKCKVIAFPIMGYWMDIGNKEDYERAQQDIKYLTL